MARPWGYLQGRHRESSAFSSSRASAGKELPRGGTPQGLGPPFVRDSDPRSSGRHLDPFPAQTLATLIVSRHPGYGGVASAQSVATLSQLAPMWLIFRDGHSMTRSASRHLSDQLPRRRTVGKLIPRWQNDRQPRADPGRWPPVPEIERFLRRADRTVRTRRATGLAPVTANGRRDREDPAALRPVARLIAPGTASQGPPRYSPDGAPGHPSASDEPRELTLVDEATSCSQSHNEARP